MLYAALELPLFFRYIAYPAYHTQAKGNAAGKDGWRQCSMMLH